MAQPGAATSEYVHDCQASANLLTCHLPGLGQPSYLPLTRPRASYLPTYLLFTRTRPITRTRPSYLPTTYLPTYQASVNLTLELSTNGQHHARTAAGFTFEYYAPDSNPNPNPNPDPNPDPNPNPDPDPDPNPGPNPNPHQPQVLRA